MKIAIVFSGVPRELDTSSDRIKEMMVGGYDVDIYSYVWRLGDWADVESKYEHTDLQVLDPAEYSRFPANKHNIFPHWYGVQRACRLFQEQCRKHNRHYDFVVRTRHDIWPYYPVDYSALSHNHISVAARHWPDHPTFVFDDSLAVSSHENYVGFYDGFFDWYLQRPMQHWFDISELKLAECAVDRGFQHMIRRETMLDFILTRAL